MADTKKPKNEKFRTPRGVFVYPKLNEPDTKFNAEGIYSLRLRLSSDEAKPLIEKIEAAAAAKFDAEKAELMKGDGKSKAKAKQLKMVSDKPYRAVVDDDGNETGDVEFNIKMRAQRTDKKTGKVIKMKPAIFDAKGKELKAPPMIWGGTEGKVSGEFVPFATNIGVGVSLRLAGVQILDLVSGGQRDAKSLGFEEEDGYEGEDAPAKADDEDAASDSTESDDDPDF